MKRSMAITLISSSVAILALGSTLAISNIHSSSSENSALMGNSSDFRAVSADMEMAHIHNLTLANGQLFLGTHQGLWSQMPGKTAERIGSSQFDVMGLAIMNGMMVASGHPGTGEENVNNLGFRMSMNGGKKWDSTSLFGKVDFHRLVTSGSVAMGVSATDGALMRSEDAGKSWTTLPNPGLYDLAMDPTDSKMIIGTTQSGPLRSSDGGKNFTAIPKSPIFILLSWDKSRLVGVTPVGVLYQSLDMGSTWKQLATVAGGPMALNVNGNDIAVLVGTTVYYSTDAGLTFKARITGVPGH